MSPATKLISYAGPGCLLELNILRCDNAVGPLKFILRNVGPKVILGYQPSQETHQEILH